jgi:hypothetical protein
MTSRRKTAIEHYDLHDLTIDGAEVEFSMATITQETSWTETVHQWVKNSTEWHGQIVSDAYTPDIVEMNLLHTFFGNTLNGQSPTGYFLISRGHSRGQGGRLSIASATFAFRTPPISVSAGGLGPVSAGRRERGLPVMDWRERTINDQIIARLALAVLVSASSLRSTAEDLFGRACNAHLQSGV